MNVAAVRQTADWLGDPTTGVNALLSSVPRDVGDTAPANVTIYDETRESWVAGGTVNRAQTGAGPVLLLRAGDETVLPLFPTEGEGPYTPVDVLVAYVRRAIVNQATPAEMKAVVRDGYQTLRAVARSIALRYTTQTADPLRNGVGLARPSVTLLRQQEELGKDELILMSLRLTYPAVDPWSMASST